MPTSIDSLSDNGKIALRVNAYPDVCPICHHNIHPMFHLAYVTKNYLNLEAIFQCPNSECRHLFIATFNQPSYGVSGNEYSLTALEPLRFQARDFSSQIAAVSPRFINIFQQSQQTEALGLMEVVGPGYRKALEYLIKDYAISREQANAEAIKKKQLGSVIDDHVTDKNIKSTAKRATWLGSDETHYYRVWEDQDIKDMKVLIELTVRWVESDEMTREYETKMVAKK